MTFMTQKVYFNGSAFFSLKDNIEKIVTANGMGGSSW